jgi:hypothetical protein
MNWALLLEILPGLLQAAVQAISEVEKATGKSTPEAAAEVVSHLTPGQPNSPTLTTPSA